MASTYQNYVQPAQQLFGYQQQPYAHTQYTQLNSAQSTPYMSQSSPMYSPAYTHEYKPEPLVTSTPVNLKRQKKFKKFAQFMEMVFSVADVCSCVLTLLIQAVMVFILVKFYQTRNIPSPGRVSPWANGTKLWPTYLLAGAALATFILSLVALILSCRKKKKGVRRARFILKVVRVTIHIGSWIAIAAFYRIAKTGDDLWGWSCSDKAAAIQKYYATSLNFAQLCDIQSSSWIVSLSEVGVKVVLAAIGFYFHFQLEGIKRSVLSESGEAGWETFDHFS